MTDNLPVLKANQDLAVDKPASSSLLGRGLAAIQSRKSSLILLIENQDEIYQHARLSFNLLTDYGDRNCVAGECWQNEKLQKLLSCFDSLKKLADTGYGKAYFPLYRLFHGGASAHRNEALANHYAILAFDWCFDNQFCSDPEVWNDLGTLYRLGAGCKEDLELAMYWYRQAADAGNAEGMFNVSGMYEFGVGVEEDLETAHYWQVMAAEAGHAYAQYGLAQQYHHGELYEQDDEYEQDELAFYWYLRSASEGYKGAIYGVLEFTSQNHHLPSNDSYWSSFFLGWLTRQAVEGETWAQLYLGKLYTGDLGMISNEAESVEWFHRAASQGDAEAQNRIGLFYEFGNSVILQDYERAEYWFRQAAEQGYSKAQTNLGWLYARGNGIEKNLEQASFWYNQAASQGDSDAQILLGWLYFEEHNYVDAMSLFTEAANQGEDHAQYNLGKMYEKGLGCVLSLNAAVDWYLKSAKNGNELARNRLSELKIDWKSL